MEGRFIKTQGLDLMELAVGYFWDRYVEVGTCNEEIEYVMETLGIGEEELIEKFKVLGYSKEQ